MNVNKPKTVPIEYSQVVKAYQKIKQGGKAVGVDNETWEEFDREPEKNLYVIWNRLSSGSYYPQAVREVEVPKKGGKKRKLGIPTLRDRIAQQVVKDYMEKKIDHIFHENSYGYRPMKSAHQAVNQVRQNCLEYDWIIDLDISKFFDEIDHELMLKAVEHVMDEKWVKMYVERWLKMPVTTKEGETKERGEKGTPQGGVISPLLANLYLHFTLDAWLSKHHPANSFVRYADDVIIHCQSKVEAEDVLNAVRNRLAQTKLELNESKTRITYCKDYRRKETHENIKFEFLGFSFQPRRLQSKQNRNGFTGFSPEISQASQTKIREEIRESMKWNNTTLEISDFAGQLNKKTRGWIGYYNIFGKRSLRNVLLTIDDKLVKWIMRKHKIGKRKAVSKLKWIEKNNPNLFYHWIMGLSRLKITRAV